MPQLDASTFPSQLFWLITTFFILYVLMVKVALPRVSEVLDLRDSKIRQDLDQAQKMKSDAEDLQKNIDKILAESHEQAQMILKNAGETAQKSHQEQVQASNEKLDAILDNAAQNIKVARDAAMRDVENMSAEMVQNITNKVGHLSIGKADAKKTVKDFCN